MEASVYASDWDRLPVGVYGLGEDVDRCNFGQVAAEEDGSESRHYVISVRPFKGILVCERSVKALQAWFSSVNKT